MKDKLLNLFYFLCITAGAFACGDVFYGGFAVLVLAFPMSFPVGIITGLLGVATYYTYVFLRNRLK